LVTIGRVGLVLEICTRTDKHTDTQTDTKYSITKYSGLRLSILFSPTRHGIKLAKLTVQKSLQSLRDVYGNNSSCQRYLIK